LFSTGEEKTLLGGMLSLSFLQPFIISKKTKKASVLKTIFICLNLTQIHEKNCIKLRFFEQKETNCTVFALK